MNGESRGGEETKRCTFSPVQKSVARKTKPGFGETCENEDKS